MTKSMYTVATAIVACLVLAAAPTCTFAKGIKANRTPKSTHSAGDRVMLEVSGVEGEQATAALNKAFADSGLKANVKESKKGGKPMKLMAQADKTTDLSPLAKAVNSAIPAKASKTPASLELVFYASLTKESSVQAMSQLEKVKGVDAKRSTLDPKRGLLRVRISGAAPVTAEDIASAVKNAGIADSHFARAAKNKKL